DVNATITDKIPAHTKFVSADNGGTESGGIVKWNVAVAKGESKTVKFTVKVDKNVNGAPIDNVAKVNDGTNEYKTNETHNPTPTEPKKEVFKGGTTTNIDGKPVKGGEELIYEITYKNTTDKDVNATITDKIPAHTKFVSAENGGTESGGTVKWNVAVAKDQSVKVKFTVKVDNDVNGAPIDNVAKVNDGTNEYKTNETHNPTPTKPKKEVFKYGTTTNIDGKKVEPGQKLTYAITYKNTTGSERDVTITDNIPTYTTFVSADNDGVFADGKVTWTKKVAAGKTYKVTFTVQVNKDAYEVMVINKATVRDGFNDSDTNVVKNPTPKKTVPGIRKPKTGDDNNIIPFAILLLASLGGLGGTVTIRRKRH
ncbi:LPXTG cell wall anchor domain-containing protein, partial [Mogibacterium timidum]|uniref:LPXTG cell wall anchor domain-containing protein n=1 Tax=Mogibacterium timidum TaxID=35519 RepID=UPI0028D4FBF3